ncbi:DUF6850 family outer membrane beta-barrel protein [Prevotella sp. OH937_COT-195]|uniref:DUF6850 family outer membrane beta-barrel protein n=1 Tax=Prevotella sp. OH937_COT-195 TaxID=2491051 RepID=UPI000F64937C|nr:DUF6850 family outer membrane beta-barrel protein [Prevotella sp. OH937_COT-195]RRD00274.1 hypothetical protein EII32_07135 [Prevotella sp. OH937_COT-195]
MTIRHICIALLATTMPVTNNATATEREHEAADSVACRIANAAGHHNLFLNTLNSWMQNPALFFDAYAGTYGQLGIYADTRREKEAFVMQEGNGLHNTGIKATTYRRLGSNGKAKNSEHRSMTVVWGEASYRNGKRKNVEWNASSDWKTIYPYVLADTIGGNRNTERYTFQGGCATRFGGLTVGEELTFRAEHEWSTRDPRMRGIVTDLKIRTAIGCSILKHRTALGGTLKLYKQTNSVEFYREEGKVPEYQMSGLGNWYERFSGTNNNAYYKAAGGGIDLGIQPHADGRGVILTASYEYVPYKRILSNLNALPINRLYVTRWQTLLGWRSKTVTNAKGNGSFMAWISMNGEKRRGDEIIGGESTADEFAVRGYLTMYDSRTIDIHAGTMASVRLGRGNTTTLKILAGRHKYSSSYAFPHSRLDFCKNYVGGTLQWQTLGRRWLLTADMTFRYDNNVSGEFTTTSSDSYTVPTKEDVAEAKRKMTERYTASAMASYTQLLLGVHAEWHPQFMGNMGLFAGIRAGYRKNDVGGNNHGHVLHASAGITF